MAKVGTRLTSSSNTKTWAPVPGLLRGFSSWRENSLVFAVFAGLAEYIHVLLLVDAATLCAGWYIGVSPVPRINQGVIMQRAANCSFVFVATILVRSLACPSVSVAQPSEQIDSYRQFALE